jgi:putative flippase GtrA
MTNRDDEAPASAAPTSKVVTGGVAGAVTVLVVWGCSLAGLDVPAPVAAAFTTLVSFAASYLKTER